MLEADNKVRGWLRVGEGFSTKDGVWVSQTPNAAGIRLTRFMS